METRFVYGADLLRNLVERYEVEPDKHHTIWNIRTLYRAYSINDHLACLGTMLTFDALISNTDRHPENWGLLAKPDASGASTLNRRHYLTMAQALRTCSRTKWLQARNAKGRSSVILRAVNITRAGRAKMTNAGMCSCAGCSPSDTRQLVLRCYGHSIFRLTCCKMISIDARDSFCPRERLFKPAANFS